MRGREGSCARGKDFCIRGCKCDLLLILRCLGGIYERLFICKRNGLLPRMQFYGSFKEL